jgi:sulfur-oxidizing protein SoxX
MSVWQSRNPNILIGIHLRQTCLTLAWCCATLWPTTQAAAQPVTDYRIDNGEIRSPLAGLRGDPVRGRAIVLNNNEGACLLCHTVPDSGAAFMGNLGPPLAGTGARLGAGALRLRMVDSTRINPQSIMPAYHRVDGLQRVGAAWRGKPVLTAQQVEDVVAYLQGLK